MTPRAEDGDDQAGEKAHEADEEDDVLDPVALVALPSAAQAEARDTLGEHAATCED